MTIFQKELIRSLHRHSSKIAIEYRNEVITYEELLIKSNVVKSFLLRQGVGKDTVVGIQMDHRVELICAVIGILSTGAAFSIIDSSWPTIRQVDIIEALDLQHIMVSSPLLHQWEGLEVYNFSVMQEREGDIHSDDIQQPLFAEEDSLYVYFTSGSTGKPKGVVGQSKSLLQFLKWEILTFGIDENTRCSQFVNPSFDAFLRDVFVPLLAGGTLCIPSDPRQLENGNAIADWINISGVHLIHCVPSLFRLFNNEQLTSDHFRDLQYILMSGEKIIPSELTNWYALFGSRIQLVNLYGLTETTMIRTFYRINPEDTRLDIIPIGVPIDDTTLLIANKEMTPCEPLISGDLYIITEYTTKGYLNDPVLTKDRFRKLNDDPVDKRIAFRTGDRARMLMDGNIVLLGREDRMIKLNGIRIELDEIESILTEAPFVKQAIVMFQEADTAFIAVFVKRDPTLPKTVDLECEIECYLADRLPTYMLPVIMEVEEFPLLSTGKVNRRKLLQSLSNRNIVAPADQMEAAILKLWKEILGDKQISVEESFHRMGGSSLNMMNLIGKIYQQFNVRISLMDLFANMTIRKQAVLIKRSSPDQFFLISKVPEKPTYVVSAAQERIYYEYEMNKTSTAYNLPMVFEMKGEIESRRLVEALNVLIQRHESLRTAFLFDGSRVLQEVKKNVNLELEETDVAEQEATAAIKKFIRPFDLANAPLIRAGLMHIADGRDMLVIDTHHIICDGISQNILCRDFAAIYNGETQTPLSIQFRDYAEWEQRLRMSLEYLSFREFWLKQFDDEVPASAFGLPVQQDTIFLLSGSTEKFKIDRKIIQPMLDYFSKENISIFSVLFAVCTLYISNVTGQEDVVIGIPSGGRSHTELEPLVGMFVKTLPIRQKINRNTKLKDFVREVHQHLMAAYNNQYFDLTDILKVLSERKGSRVISIFDVFVGFQDYEENDLPVNDISFSQVAVENNVAKFPIAFYCNTDSDSLYFRLEYMRSLFSREDIQKMITQFIHFVSDSPKHLDNNISLLLNLSVQPQFSHGDLSFNLD